MRALRGARAFPSSVTARAGAEARTRLLPAAALSLLLGAAAPATSPPAAPGFVEAWLDGDAAAALAALARLPTSRERDFNEAVALLYSGDAEAAERAFVALRAREGRWLPAVRWLARAQKEQGRPEATLTAATLVELPGATSGDWFWAARLFAERNDLPRARDAFARAVATERDLCLAWRGLGDVENALGHADAARAARTEAEAVCPDAHAQPPALAPPLPPVPLRYRAKYLFLKVADVTLTDMGPLVLRDRPARRLALVARSTGAGRLFRIDSRFESLVAEDGTLLANRNLSNDSTSPRNQSVVDFDPAAGLFRGRRVRDGLLLYDVFPAPPLVPLRDGLSLIEAARAVARAGGAHSVLRLADATWKGTVIRKVGAERIRWQSREIDTACVEIGILSKGTAGVQGKLQLWISTDDRAIPYRARIAIAIGSIGLELVPPDAGEASTRE
jgi:tetratricopeptide (TPR) repeat protein